MPKPIRVLILEDRAADAELMVHELRRAGFDPDFQRVEAEPNYLVALTTNPDLILADWTLPQFSGWRALKLMREQKLDIPFIIVSGSIGEDAAVEAVREGAADYLIKDRLGRLGEAVRRALKDKLLREERKRAEEEISDSERKFRSLVEQSSDGIVIINQQGMIIDWNNRQEQITGIKQVEALGRPIWEVQFQMMPEEISRPEMLARFKVAIMSLLETGKSPRSGQELETVLQLPDGTRRTILMTTYQFKTEKGFMAGSITRDITERKRAEEKLTKERILLETLINNLPDHIYAMDVQGRKTLSNVADWRASGGNSVEDVIGKTDMDTYPPELAEKYWALDKAVIDTGVSIINQEEPGLDSKGNPVWLLTSKVPLRDHLGNIIGLVGIGRDITERKRAEEALRQSETELRALFASMHEVVIEIDREGVYRKIAPTNPELLVKPPEELVGKSLQDVFPTKQAENFINVLQKVVDTKQTTQIEYELPIGDHTVQFEAAISPLTEDSTLWVAHDITARKQAEEKIRILNAELEQRVEERTRELRQAQEKIARQEKLAMLGQLAGGVGHELRNPLGIISSGIYYLQLIQPDAEERVRKYHKMIEQEVRNSEKIITDLLDFARLESMERDLVSVRELVDRTLVRFPVPSSIKTAINISVDLPKVFTDPHQMEQVLGNLIVNAYQAMLSPRGTSLLRSTTGGIKRGELTISAKMQKGMVGIGVKDDGVGISPENMSKLFEPLFTTKSKGIGLGLAVSKKLAEANGGRIEVKSELGKGSIFTLFLPVEGG